MVPQWIQHIGSTFTSSIDHVPGKDLVPPGLLLLIAFSVLSGCAEMDQYLKDMNKPDVRVEKVTVGRMGLEQLRLVAHTSIHNPYSVSLPLVNANYGLFSEGKQILSGESNLDGSVPAGKRKTVKLPVQVQYSDVLKVLKGVRPGAVIPYDAKFGFLVNTPAGNVEIPVRHQSKFPIPNVPDVSVESIGWTNFSMQDVGANLKLRVKNTNSFAYNLKKVDFDLSLAGTRLMETTVSRSKHLNAGESGTIEIPISFSPANAGLSFFRSLKSDQLNYRFKGNIKGDTAFGPLQLPVDSKGNTSTSGR